MTKPTHDFFNKEQAEGYDERNRKLAPISDGLHFLMSLIMKDLPSNAQVLSVGAGTGAEILALAGKFPQWTFVAVEPSLAMVDVCRSRLKSAGLLQRCEIIHGYVQDLPAQRTFDAVLCMLVAHFVKHDEKLKFYQALTDRVGAGGMLVNAEISFDLESAEFEPMLKSWKVVQTMMGATPESLAALPQVMKDVLAIIPPHEAENLLRQSGIVTPVRFYQALMIAAWYGIKTV